MIDLANNSKATVVFEMPDKRVDGKSPSTTPYGLRWSPGGTQLGFLHDYREYGTFVVAWRVGVVNANGTGAKTVFDLKHTDPKPPIPSLTLFDWR